VALATGSIHRLMRTPVRSRLLLSHLTVLLIGMGLAATLVWLAVAQMYILTQRENLLAQAKLIAATLQGVTLSIEPTQPYLQSANVQPGIHSRIIGEQGGVIVDLPLPVDNTPVQSPPAESSGFISPTDLLLRSEIQLAMQGEPATAIRKIPMAGNRRVLYAAAPISATNGNIDGIIYLAAPLPPTGLPDNLEWQLAGVLLVAILLASAAGMLLAASIAKPIEAVANAANAVSSGDLEQRVPVKSNLQELNSLGEAFNTMTASLRQSDQIKNSFIADVTHELRTPLTVIKGTIETLVDGALDDITGRGPLLASMERETDRLIRLVNDLLVLARADAGKLKLDIEPLDLGILARARCETHAALAAKRHIDLRVDDHSKPSKSCPQGDADRLVQVLDNLLDNAIRHTPDHSTVMVSIQQTKNEIQCTVSDQGDGIPVEHLPFIFERFYRVDASRNRQTGGTGLGLAIARTLVQSQGGHINARSIERQGTEITFCLPLSEDCHPTA